MKALNFAVKIITVVIIGTLFFSCAWDTEDNGTLIIPLPGDGSARAAVSPEFTATLRYVIDCSGPGSVSRNFRSGERASISLAAGSWNVTVRALNVANQEIGKGSASVTIEGGKTTAAQIPITIDATRKSITDFVIKWPVFSVGCDVVDLGTSNRITIYVLPYNEYDSAIDDEQVEFYITHTGRKLVVQSGGVPNQTPLSFGDFCSSLFIVYAEDDEDEFYGKYYTVTIEQIEIDSDYYETYFGWSQIPWGYYGLSNMEIEPADISLCFGMSLKMQSFEMLTVMLNYSSTSPSLFNDLCTRIGTNPNFTEETGVSYGDQFSEDEEFPPDDFKIFSSLGSGKIVYLGDYHYDKNCYICVMPKL